MYLSVQVSESLGRLIVPWTIIEFLEEGLSFGDLLSCIKAGRFSVVEVSDDLKQAKLSKTFVGNKPDALIVSGSDQCVMAVCSQFGIYVKFSVELPEEEVDVPISRPNAFSVMIAAQRRVQSGDNGLPNPKVVRDSRDRLYNDSIGLM